ncbi:PKD domain protein [uncultured archaeon]|nr:PKD domain protein [uncultured archaeon]
MRPHIILWIILLIAASPAFCKDIAYVFSEGSEHPADNANLTDYNGKDMVSFATAAGPKGSSVSQGNHKTVDSIKEEINAKLNMGNQVVRDEGLRLTGRRSGAQRIDQICSIYDDLVGNWTYISDWRGSEIFQYSNYTLEMGKTVGSLGKGDCDDFAILMASLIDAIGGTPRVILAYGPEGGHAYAEVYLGKKGSQDKDLSRILEWLRSEYQVKDIYCHTDPKSGDIWLNLDWWKDSNGATHPGGPFFQASAQIPIPIREDINKTSLTPIENSPPCVLFNYTPLKPEVGETIIFDASSSVDSDGQIVNYEWSFGEGSSAQGRTKAVCPFIYAENGRFFVNLTLTDDGGDKSLKTQEINIAEPLPEVFFNYSPTAPKAGEAVTFDASQSKDKRGQIIEYEWDFGDGYSGKGVSIKHQYLDTGTYKVTCDVKNDRGMDNISAINLAISPKEPKSEKSTPEKNAMTIVSVNASVGDLMIVPENVSVNATRPLANTAIDNEESKKSRKTQAIIIAEPRPEAVIRYNPTSPKIGEAVTFDASQSKDKRGQIIGYEWDFGDGYSGKGASIRHSFLGSGDYDVRLTITNDRGIKNTSNKIVIIRQDESSNEIETWPAETAFGPYNGEKILMLGSGGTAPTGAVPSSGYDATVTIRSTQYTGYDVTVDGNYIGTDGKGQDPLDGVFTFKVSGNQQHLIKANHPYNWKWWQYLYNAGETYTYDF